MKTKITDAQLIQLIRNLPEQEPKLDLAPLVLRSLKPKRMSFLDRLLLHIRSPRLIIVTPFRLSLAASGCALLFVLLTLNFSSSNLQHRTAALKPGVELVPVAFNLSNVKAKKVSVIGAFNNWRPEQHDMKFDSAKNSWIIEIAIPPGEYEYAYLIDNQQAVVDPKADFYKKDGFGSRNSIVFVPSNDENFL
jgi:hypothetical protein